MPEISCIRALLFFSFLMAPLSASGAPFCVESQGIAPECWYYDVRACKEEAAKRSGHCSANPEEVALPEDNISFCLIGSDKSLICSFQSSEDCFSEAAKQNAVCFQNAKGDDQGDPYRFDRPPFRYQ